MYAFIIVIQTTLRISRNIPLLFKNIYVKLLILSEKCDYINKVFILRASMISKH